MQVYSLRIISKIGIIVLVTLAFTCSLVLMLWYNHSSNNEIDSICQAYLGCTLSAPCSRCEWFPSGGDSEGSTWWARDHSSARCCVKWWNQNKGPGPDICPLWFVFLVLRFSDSLESFASSGLYNRSGFSFLFLIGPLPVWCPVLTPSQGVLGFFWAEQDRLVGNTERESVRERGREEETGVKLN